MKAEPDDKVNFVKTDFSGLLERFNSTEVPAASDSIVTSKQEDDSMNSMLDTNSSTASTF